VAFEIPSVDGGRPFGIDTKRWPGLQRAVAEDFATFMSARSYFEHQVLIGSFIIDRARNRPPNSFFTWAESCSLYSGQNERQATDFHLNAMRKAHLAYLLVP
jgi:hypothetical protein